MEPFSLSILAIRSTIISSFLICLILLIRLLIGRKIHPNLKYCIWFLLVIRLLIPYAPQSPVSIYNLIPNTLYNVQQGIDIYGINTESGIGIALNQSRDMGEDGSGPDILPILWVFGVLCFCFHSGSVTIRFMSRLKNSSVMVTNPDIQTLLNECRHTLGIKKKLSLLETNSVQTPALFGLLRPKLLLPLGSCRNYSPDHLKYVFLHELAHSKRFDNYTVLLTSVLQALFWFNPLVWLAFFMMHRDREIACDYHVLSCLKPCEYKRYGEAVIHAVKGYTLKAGRIAVTGMDGSIADVRNRITMIAIFGKITVRWPILAVIGILLLCGLVLTDCMPLNDTNNRINAHAGQILVDKIDYPFENDAALIGNWSSVDFVKSIDNFQPDKKTWRDTLYLNMLVFNKGGKTEISTINRKLKNSPYIRWTNGLIIHLGDRTAAKYSIKKLEGKTYLFMEWKSGDYIFRKMKPYYYVLEKTT